MTNLNKTLADWLLRDILELEERELAIIEKLDELGFDGIVVSRSQERGFLIDIMKTGSYSEFRSF